MKRHVLIHWVGGPFDGKTEKFLPAVMGPATRQAFAVPDGSGKIQSIAWYRLDQVSEGSWRYVFDRAESQEEFRDSVAGATAPPPERPAKSPHFPADRRVSVDGR